MGGPQIPHAFGRTDDNDGKNCPENGRLPDAAQGAEHLREVFGRMGFGDREIVALSGGHTVGRCHLVRSGFDGPWTRSNLAFNNEYFRNLMFLEWTRKDWDGPEQYEDPTGELMMLPTDIALKTDPEFAKWARAYANDQDLFFDDFAKAYGKLLALGCPEEANPFNKPGIAPPLTPLPEAPAASSSSASASSSSSSSASSGGGCPFSGKAKASAKFRELAMHGSVGPMGKIASDADVKEAETYTGRTAFHKAAFWGHVAAIEFLTSSPQAVDVIDAQDVYGDTALHDASRFGHVEVVQLLLAAGASTTVTNSKGLTPIQVASEYNKPDIVALLSKHRTSSRL